MRIAYTPEIQKKWDAVCPYMVRDGLNYYLSASAPKYIQRYLEEVDAYENETRRKEEADSLEFFAEMRGRQKEQANG